MEKLFRILKNWWILVLAVIGFILDSLDAINPILVELGMNNTVINVLKAVFVLWSLYKAKKSLPTQNSEKLKNIVKKKISADAEGEGAVQPGKAP